jgi:hypothetical protein
MIPVIFTEWDRLPFVDTEREFKQGFNSICFSDHRNDSMPEWIRTEQRYLHILFFCKKLNRCILTPSGKIYPVGIIYVIQPCGPCCLKISIQMVPILAYIPIDYQVDYQLPVIDHGRIKH